MRNKLVQLFQNLECSDLAWLRAAEDGSFADFQKILKNRSLVIQKISDVLTSGQCQLTTVELDEVVLMQAKAASRQARLKVVAGQLRDESRRQWTKAGAHGKSAVRSPYSNQSKGARKSVTI